VPSYKRDHPKGWFFLFQSSSAIFTMRKVKGSPQNSILWGFVTVPSYKKRDHSKGLFFMFLFSVLFFLV
jgi:hypothetical protein